MTVSTAEGTVRSFPGVGSLEFVQSPTRREYWWTPIVTDANGVEANRPRKRLTSVTTILDQVIAKGWLEGYLQKYGFEGARERTDAGKSRGTAVHDFIAHYLTTGDILPLGSYPLEQRPYVQAAARFLFEYALTPAGADDVETLVCHPAYGYAGTFDLRATIDGKATLLDFKTSEKGGIYAQAHMQAHAYALADELHGAPKVEAIKLVGFSEDGSYRVVTGVDGARQAWLAAVAFFQSYRKLEAECRKGERR